MDVASSRVRGSPRGEAVAIVTCMIWLAWKCFPHLLVIRSHVKPSIMTSRSSDLRMIDSYLPLVILLCDGESKTLSDEFIRFWGNFYNACTELICRSRTVLMEP